MTAFLKSTTRITHRVVDGVEVERVGHLQLPVTQVFCQQQNSVSQSIQRPTPTLSSILIFGNVSHQLLQLIDVIKFATGIASVLTSAAVAVSF